jgi:predicted component of type VI protein secretion system
MSANSRKPPQTRVELIPKIPSPDGPREKKLPPKFVIVAALTGDKPSDYATAKPVALTRENIANLGGLRPEIHDVVVTDKVLGEIRAEKLIFSKLPKEWPAQIVEQIPQLRAMKTLLEALFEVQRNPRLRRQLADWLANNPETSQVLKRLATEGTTKK